VPAIVQAMIRAKDFDEYDDAELVRKKNRAVGDLKQREMGRAGGKNNHGAKRNDQRAARPARDAREGLGNGGDLRQLRPE
jgi:capsid protein